MEALWRCGAVFPLKLWEPCYCTLYRGLHDIPEDSNELFGLQFGYKFGSSGRTEILKMLWDLHHNDSLSTKANFWHGRLSPLSCNNKNTERAEQEIWSMAYKHITQSLQVLKSGSPLHLRILDFYTCTPKHELYQWPNDDQWPKRIWRFNSYVFFFKALCPILKSYVSCCHIKLSSKDKLKFLKILSVK